MQILNPTGKGIRNDKAGLGHYGAPRGRRKHDGVDLMCNVGQDILMPVDGIITRVSMPYADDDRWLGAYIVNPRIEIKMWYFVPTLLGMKLKAGTVIGTAQDIGIKYEGVTPHIHFRVCRIDPMLILSETDEELYENILMEA